MFMCKTMILLKRIILALWHTQTYSFEYNLFALKQVNMVLDFDFWEDATCYPKQTNNVSGETM